MAIIHGNKSSFHLFIVSLFLFLKLDTNILRTRCVQGVVLGYTCNIAVNKIQFLPAWILYSDQAEYILVGKYIAVNVTVEHVPRVM